MDDELYFLETPNDFDMAFLSEALFEQYDEELSGPSANDDCYENLYPGLA